jgi:hypothetical protein
MSFHRTEPLAVVVSLAVSSAARYARPVPYDG